MESFLEITVVDWREQIITDDGINLTKNCIHKYTTLKNISTLSARNDRSYYYAIFTAILESISIAPFIGREHSFTDAVIAVHKSLLNVF
jgi:hypothetical protein